MYNARKEFELKNMYIDPRNGRQKTSSRWGSLGTRLHMYVHVCMYVHCMYACTCIFMCVHILCTMYVYCVACTCICRNWQKNPIFIIFVIKCITMATTLNLFWFKVKITLTMPLYMYKLSWQMSQ